MRISRSKVINTAKTHVYIYADNYGFTQAKGQSATFTGLSNCYPIPTKWRCCEEISAFFYDRQFEMLIKPLIDNTFKYIKAQIRGRKVIIIPKIGEGCSKLSINAPKTLAYIKEQLMLLNNEKHNSI